LVTHLEFFGFEDTSSKSKFSVLQTLLKEEFSSWNFRY